MRSLAGAGIAFAAIIVGLMMSGTAEAPEWMTEETKPSRGKPRRIVSLRWLGRVLSRLGR
jgi:hypothetical protein